MARGANLSVMDMRNAARHSVDHVTIAEHRSLGDIKVHIVNISANGFMTEGDMPLQKGERITVRLPSLGQMEAHLIWTLGGRCGFQLERIVRQSEFGELVKALKSSISPGKYR